MSKTPTLYHDDGSEEQLPFRWIICSACRGEGKSSAYLGAFTAEDMDEAGPEFVEDYIAGNYDRACDTCGGSGKLKEVDPSKTPKAKLREFRRQEQDNADCDRIQRQELLAEGGWRELDWYGR